MKLFKNLLPLACMAVACTIVFSCNNDADTKDDTASGDSSTVSNDSTNKMDHSTHQATPAPDTATVPTMSSASATISGTYPDTAVNGTATFETAADGKIKLKLDITVPAKAGKSVAVHLHEHGDCGDNGKASHGHWNPTNAQHGKWGSGSFHSGDIGNVKLDSKGKGSVTITTDLWTLGGKPDKNILGKAMIVHGGTDDFTTQPTGNAGSRIGCGLIQGK